MTLSTLISDESAPTAPFAADLALDHPPQPSLQSPDDTSCRFEIDRVVREIEIPEVRDIVQTVFSDLLRWLECLGLIEGHLRQIDYADETFALFQFIQGEARLLVEFIREEGLNCPVMDAELSDTLDGIAFAINHDLQRVFDTGQRPVTSEKSAHVTVATLYRAHDLLTNCLQQSTITLAMMFDPELVGARLFNNSDMRYRQSLQLCGDLTTLLQLIDISEKNTDGPTLDTLAAGIEKFRNESLDCLMYSDWPQFESFCERIKVAGNSSTQLESVLHQFRCYLETLLGQVKMRAVLANVFPIRCGADESVTSSVEQSTPLSPSSDSREATPAWDEFAVAV